MARAVGAPIVLLLVLGAALGGGLLLLNTNNNNTGDSSGGDGCSWGVLWRANTTKHVSLVPGVVDYIVVDIDEENRSVNVYARAGGGPPDRTVLPTGARTYMYRITVLLDGRKIYDNYVEARYGGTTIMVSDPDSGAHTVHVEVLAYGCRG